MRVQVTGTVVKAKLMDEPPYDHGYLSSKTGNQREFFGRFQLKTEYGDLHFNSPRVVRTITPDGTSYRFPARGNRFLQELPGPKLALTVQVGDKITIDGQLKLTMTHVQMIGDP